MTDIFKRYTRRPADIDAAQVAEHTAQQIAIWCGGSWGREQDRGSDTYLEIVVPNVEGNQKAHVNDYVVRKPNGRFYVMKPAEMAAEEYIEVGGKLNQPVGPTALTPHYVPRGKHPFGV